MLKEISFWLFLNLNLEKNVTLELFEHIEPAVDQPFPPFPHPELQVPLVHEHDGLGVHFLNF